MIANGGFAPLGGFQGSDDWRRVCEEMRLAAGDGATGRSRSPSRPTSTARSATSSSSPSDEGKPLGRLTVEEIFERDAEREAEQVYGTTDEAHPGVAAIYEEGDRCIAGPIEADELPDHEEAFMRRYLTPEESQGGVRGARLEAGSSPSRPATRSTAPTST